MHYIIPAVIAFILIFALKSHTDTYNSFIQGAEDGMKIAAGIFPSLLAIIVAAQMLRASGAIDLILNRKIFQVIMQNFVKNFSNLLYKPLLSYLLCRQ